MKMKSLATKIIVALALIVGLTSIGPAQNREKFGISAQAGGVNALTGRVLINRPGQAERELTDQDNLISGDSVTTGAGSSAEILLNPGSYLRLGEDSEFQLVDASLDKLALKLTKGSAIVEATGWDQMQLHIVLATNQGGFVIGRAGVYRINAQSDASELMVRKGRVTIGDDSTHIVKQGNKVVLRKGAVLVSKLKNQEQDEFDLWSRQRAATLAHANEALASRAFNSYLAGLNSFSTLAASSEWGVWAFNPLAHGFTFMPFFYGCNSPYGHRYGSYFFDPFCGVCGSRVVREPLIVSYPTSGGSPVNAPSGSFSPGSASGSPATSVGLPSAPQAQPQSAQPIRGDADSAPRIPGKPRDPK